MPHLEYPFPIVLPFDIEPIGWSVSDLRSINQSDCLAVQRIYNQAALEFVESEGIPKEETICQWSEPAGAFHRFNSSSPLDALFLSVRRGGELVGGIHVSKFDVEREDTEKIVSTAMIWAAVTDAEGVDEVETHLSAIRFLIHNDLALDDGRVLDLIGYNMLAYNLDVPLTPDQSRLTAFRDGMMSDYDATVEEATGDIRFRRKLVI
jgi:hypothetical protein